MRTRPGLAARAREAAGPALPSLLARTWELLARIHHDDPAVQRTVLAGLRGLEGLVARADDERVALSGLFAARGGIHRSIGSLDQAWRDHEAALAVLAPVADAQADRLRGPIHATLAIMLAGVDAGRALHHATQATLRDTSPELVRERLRRYDAVASLVARDRAWRELLDPGP